VRDSKVVEVMRNVLFVYVAETHSFDKQAIESCFLLVNNQLKISLGVFFFRRYLENKKNHKANLVFSVKWKVNLPIRTNGTL
jgi:hypothetical protein